MWFTVIRLIEMGRLGHVVCIMAMRTVYKILVWKPQRKRPLEYLHYCLQGNKIKGDLKGVGCGNVNWINLAQGNKNFRFCKMEGITILDE